MQYTRFYKYYTLTPLRTANEYVIQPPYVGYSESNIYVEGRVIVCLHITVEKWNALPSWYKIVMKMFSIDDTYF